MLFYSKTFLSLRARCAIISPFFPHFRPFFCVSCLALGRLRDVLTSCNSHSAPQGLCSLRALHRLASSFEMWQRAITLTQRASSWSQHPPYAKDPLQWPAASVRKQRWASCRKKRPQLLVTTPSSFQNPLNPGLVRGSQGLLLKRDFQWSGLSLCVLEMSTELPPGAAHPMAEPPWLSHSAAAPSYPYMLCFWIKCVSWRGVKPYYEDTSQSNCQHHSLLWCVFSCDKSLWLPTSTCLASCSN